MLHPSAHTTPPSRRMYGNTSTSAGSSPPSSSRSRCKRRDVSHKCLPSLKPQWLTIRATGLEQIAAKTTSIDKYMYLSNLRNTNTDLFYRLLIDNMKVCSLSIPPRCCPRSPVSFFSFSHHVALLLLLARCPRLSPLPIGSSFRSATLIDNTRKLIRMATL